MNNPPLAQLAEATVLNTVQLEFESLKGDHPFYKPPIWKIYGPYQNKKDLRRRVIAYDGTQKITISYPKFIMECKFQKILELNEEVHHKNELEFDDRIKNFEIRNKSEHVSEHRTNFPEFFNCSHCGKLFWLKGTPLSRMKSERKRFPDMQGPYCSRSCAGYAGK